MASVFISHSSRDKGFATRLAEDLERLGHRPWLDEWEIKVGECIVTRLDRGIADSDYVVIVLSSHSVTSGWVEKEWKTKYWSEIEAGRPLVLPVLIEDCDIPGLLKTKKYADFREKYPVGLVELANALASQDEEAGGREPRRTMGVEARPTWGRRQVGERGGLGYYWHPVVHEHLGHFLHLILVRYKSESIVFKRSVLNDLAEAEAGNYLIFELFAEWDILVRLWATENVANNVVRRLQGNSDIANVDHLRVSRHICVPDDGKEFSRQDIIRAIDDLGLTALRDVHARGHASAAFQAAVERGVLLCDTVAFDPSRIQFYVLLRSMRRPGEASVRQLLRGIEQWQGIRGRTLYVTAGTSIRMVVKAQAEAFYDITEFLHGVTEALKDEVSVVSTETMLVADRDIKCSNLIDFDRAEGEMLERSFSSFLSSLPVRPVVPLELKLTMMGKYHSILSLLPMDDQGVLLSLLRARISGSPEHMKQVTDFFPQFEQALRDNLPAVLRKLYTLDWQQQLDAMKTAEGISEGVKVNRMVLGDLVKVYKLIVEEQGILALGEVSPREFDRVMDELPEFRNALAHRGASLEGWDSLFDFCRRFVPVRHAFFAYFAQLGSERRP